MNDSPDNPTGSTQGEKICWQCGETYGPDQQYCNNDGSELVEVNPSETQDMLVGHIFDERFRVVEKLGEGGMSRVYHARRVKGGEEVALKILKADFLQDTEIRKRFMYEARVIANLDHPNAVELFDFGQAPDGSFYMVMELLKGESLNARLDDSCLRYQRIFEYIAPICGVLYQAHQQDIVHRDLKPENIYLKREASDTYRPKLLDFGIAKHLRSRTMTQDDAMWGTPAYMSPEQASGDDVTAASDIYAVGVILYELVAGVLPHRASTSMGFAVKHMQSDVRPLRKLPGLLDIPDDLDVLVLEMLSKDPDDRPASMRSVEQELGRIVDEELFPHQFDVVPADQIDRDQLVTPENEEGKEAGKESGRLEMDDELRDAKTQALDGGEVEQAAAATETPIDPHDTVRDTVPGGQTVQWSTWSEFPIYRLLALAVVMLLAGGLVGGAYWAFEMGGLSGNTSKEAAAETPRARSGHTTNGANGNGPSVEPIVATDDTSDTQSGESSDDEERTGSAELVGRAATYGADVLMRSRDVADAIEEKQQQQRREKTRRRPARQAGSSNDSEDDSAPSQSDDTTASGDDEKTETKLESIF